MVLRSFLPISLFVGLYVGCGLYLSWHGVANAFYQLPATVAIIPAIILAWLLHRGSTNEKITAFLDGVRHPDIIAMCFIFLLAGAFSSITTAIGSVDATVNCAISFIHPHFLLIGIFLTAAFISLAIGTSMGTIATIAPLAATLAKQGAFSPALGMATVVGGAMFGDNLSLISDTTIAAVLSQEASMKEKFKLNGLIAVIASIITIIILFFMPTASDLMTTAKTYSLLLIVPYLFLIALALRGIHVFIVLLASIALAGIIGFIDHGYQLAAFNHDLVAGFASMHEIMLLSLLVGGLSGLVGKQAIEQLTNRIIQAVEKRKNKQRAAQYAIAAIVSLFDILLANNTIAIIFSGDIARSLAHRYAIPAHYSATWLDTFSCVFQGLIPYGAQLLLAAAIGGISPLTIIPSVYYCFIVGIVGLLFIAFDRRMRLMPKDEAHSI